MNNDNYLDKLRVELAQLTQHDGVRKLAAGTREQGRRIASIPRPYENQEVRIILQDYKGNPVTQIGLWQTDEAGRTWIVPSRQYWIRKSELVPVAEALLQVLEILREDWEPGAPEAESSDAW